MAPISRWARKRDGAEGQEGRQKRLQLASRRPPIDYPHRVRCSRNPPTLAPQSDATHVGGAGPAVVESGPKLIPELSGGVRADGREVAKSGLAPVLVDFDLLRPWPGLGR